MGTCWMLLFVIGWICINDINFTTAAPATVPNGNDLPSNWKDLIGNDVLTNPSDSHAAAQGATLFEGDIKGVDKSVGSSDPNALTNMAHNAVMDRSQLWPGGVVPYVIGSGYNSQQKSVIEGALQDIMQKTCVKFVRRTNERDYIQYVNRNSGCSSYVARVGGQQLIDLQEGCIYEFGEVQHETMHALGFFHEQSRKDRDDYVTIVWSNIIRDDYDQFEKYQSNLLGLPYDYDSIMHYGWNYFATDRSQPTIVPKKKASIGNRKEMSPIDVQKINLLYQCKGVSAPSSSGGSGSSSGGRRPSGGSSFGGSGGSGRGTSILDILFGGLGGSGDNGSRWGDTDQEAVTSQPAPRRTAPPAPPPRGDSGSGSSNGGISGAIKGFLKGLFG